MALSKDEFSALSDAMLSDKGNSVGFDLGSAAPRDHGSFAALEASIHANLTSFVPKEVWQGLVDTFAWGMGGGDRRFISKSFQKLVQYRREDKYTLAGALFRMLDQELVDVPHLHIIKGLQIPGFSGMSYVSKLRMFLSPRRFATLDRILLNRLRNPPGSPGNILDLFHFDPAPSGAHETSIKIDDANEEAYRRWSLFCRRLATSEFGGYQIHGREVIAADVERGLHRMARSGQQQQALAILNTHAPP